MVGNTTLEAVQVHATRELLDSLGMIPRVPADLVDDVDSERLLRRVLASRPSPVRSHSLAAPPSEPPHRAAPLAGTSAPPGRRVDRRRHRRTGAAVAAVTLGVVLVAAQGPGAPPATAATLPPLSYALADPAVTPPRELPDAREALLDLAETARTTSVPVGSGQVQHVVAQQWLPELTIPASGPADLTSAIYPTVTERWVAPDGSGKITQRRSAPVLSDGSLDPGARPSSAGSTSTDTYLAGTIDATPTEGLSRVPATLTSQLVGESAAECSLDLWEAYCLADQVQSYFLSGVVPQDLSGAFWEVLAEQPDVGLLGPTTDRVGRAGTAVAVGVPTDPGEPHDERAVLVLVVSGETGQLLSTEQVTVHSDLFDITEPTVTGFSAVTRSEYTAEVG